MSTPKSFDECVATEDFNGYKEAHRREHNEISDRFGKVEINETKLETQLNSLINITKVLLGSVVSGVISIIVILLTRGI